MAFCGNCGSAVWESAGFCSNCGKPIGTTQSAQAGKPGGAANAQPTPAATGAQPSAGGLTSNVAGALAYLFGFITGIVFLVLEPYKNDRFVRFHAMQSIFYSVACIGFAIIWRILVGILFQISVGLALITFPIRMLISLGCFLLWLYVMYQAYSNREFRIPIVGALAAKQVA